jgi:hypothetical protein
MALENTLVPKNWRDRGGGFRQPQEAPTAPASADTGMRPVGFRNTGAIREQGERTAALAAGSAQVGEPTSFKAGAGAPEPIAVMRGTATTFSPGRLPGHQFAEPEMATPLQAGQAWNRGMRGEAIAAGDKRGFTTPEATLDTQYGGFREPGQTGKEIAAKAHVEGAGATTKGPFYEAQAKVLGEQAAGLKRANEAAVETQNTKAFTDLYENRFGPPPKVGTTGFEDYHDALVHAKQHGDKAGVDRYLETHMMRQVEPLFTPDNLAALRGTPQQQNNPDLSEAAWNFVQQNPQAKREYMLKYGPMLQQLRPPQPPQSVGQRLWSEQAPGEVGP